MEQFRPKPCLVGLQGNSTKWVRRGRTGDNDITQNRAGKTAGTQGLSGASDWVGRGLNDRVPYKLGTEGATGHAPSQLGCPGSINLRPTHWD